MAAPKLDNIPTIYKYKFEPMQPLREVLSKLANCSFEIDYIAVKKADLSTELKTAPFGIVYNYFSYQLLKHRFKTIANINLTVDAKNKEVHPQKHFDGYLETKFYLTQNAPAPPRTISIRHLESHDEPLLRAVDYCSWAIWEKYEKGDSRFYDIIHPNMNNQNCQTWFI